jgi:hypothetical protein
MESLSLLLIALPGQRSPLSTRKRMVFVIGWDLCGWLLARFARGHKYNEGKANVGDGGKKETARKAREKHDARSSV